MLNLLFKVEHCFFWGVRCVLVSLHMQIWWIQPSLCEDKLPLFVCMSSHKFLWRMLFGHLVLNTQLKRFLGIFSWDPSACEFNQLHVHILKFSFIHNFYRLFVDIICYIGKLAHLSMPKFLAGCHYNEEEISRHLKKNIGYCRSKWMATSLQPVKFWKNR